MPEWEKEPALTVLEWPVGSLLGRMRRRDRDALLRLGVPVSFPARQVMLRQGDRGEHALLLLSGYVKVFVGTRQGREVLVAVRGPGDLLGEMAVLEDRHRCANTVAGTLVAARLVGGAELREFLGRNAEACLSVARTVSERLRSAEKSRVDFVATPAPTRVAQVLIETAQRFGRRTPAGWDLGVPLTRAEVASLAGTALSTVEKAFHAMQNEGLLRLRYRRIVVRDLTELRRFGENPY
ncbi:MAG TPA: Crp/Fnr family transcriptional regulator [Amycolatopsis sp.]|nr:Crp/Fnr family transcriptional regulator [Amycolatopsis sp.]